MEPRDLDEVTSLSVAGAVVRLALARFTGTLRLGSAVRVVHRGGEILDVLSDREEEDLAGVMHASGKIDAAALARFRRERSPSSPVVDEMVRLGLVPAAEASKSLAWRAMTMLNQAMLRPALRLELAPGDVPAEAQRRGVDLVRLIARTWSQVSADAAQADRVEKQIDSYCVPLQGAGELVGAIKLPEKESAVWTVLSERPLSLRALAPRSALFRTRLFPFIHKLEWFSFIRLDPNPPLGSGLDLQELVRWKESLEGRSPFDVLAVHPSTFPEEVAERAAKLMEHLNVVERQGGREAAPVVAKVRDAVRAAAATLTDPNRRLEARRLHYPDEQVRQFAHLQFQKAEAFLFWRNQPAEAFALLRSAIDLTPDDASYQGHFALAAALLGKRIEAFAAIDRMLRPGLRGADARAYAVGASAAVVLGDLRRQAELADRARAAPGYDAVAEKMLRGDALKK